MQDSAFLHKLTAIFQRLNTVYLISIEIWIFDTDIELYASCKLTDISGIEQ